MEQRTSLEPGATEPVLAFPASILAQDTSTPEPGPTPIAAVSGYAPVNGLEIYYEIHGSGGTPLVVLHGAFMSITLMAPVIAALAVSRQVVAFEAQGHGRTADIDRPITYEGMADDAAALLDYLEIETADVFGYSMGGGTAQQVAIRHPEKVRKLVVGSATFNSGGYHPDLLPEIATNTPESFAGTPFHEAYLRLAPNPGDFPNLVEKLKTLDLTPQDWPAEEIASIASPSLVIVGDTDVILLEHAVEMFRLLGGNGDRDDPRDSRLAVLPGTTHLDVIAQVDLLMTIIPPFLDASLPQGGATPAS